MFLVYSHCCETCCGRVDANCNESSPSGLHNHTRSGLHDVEHDSGPMGRCSPDDADGTEEVPLATRHDHLFVIVDYLLLAGLV